MFHCNLQNQRSRVLLKDHSKTMHCYGKVYQQRPTTQPVQSDTAFNYFSRDRSCLQRGLHLSNNAEESMTMENMIPPRYNTQKYREWKKDCMHLCITPQVASVNNVLVRSVGWDMSSQVGVYVRFSQSSVPNEQDVGIADKQKA